MIETKELIHHQQTLRLWEAMGKEPVKSEHNGVERRKRVRLFVPDTVCRLDVMTGGEQRALWVTVRDVCANGACLLSEAAVPVCQMVKLHPPDTAAGQLDPVVGRVVSCRKRSDCYRIGVQFHDP